MVKSFVPKVGLPYPVGRLVCGRIVSRLARALYQIDLSGRLYTAELTAGRISRSAAPGAGVSDAGRTLKFLEPGDPVTVRVVSKSGTKAVLQIVEPDFPDIASPTPDDISRLARAAGWPEDAASHVMVAAIVARRMPLRSEMADRLYRYLKLLEIPTPDAAEKFLIDFFETKA